MAVYSRPTGFWHKLVIENTGQELQVLILRQLCIITIIVGAGTLSGIAYMIHSIATR